MNSPVSIKSYSQVQYQWGRKIKWLTLEGLQESHMAKNEETMEGWITGTVMKSNSIHLRIGPSALFSLKIMLCEEALEYST